MTPRDPEPPSRPGIGRSLLLVLGLALLLWILWDFEWSQVWARLLGAEWLWLLPLTLSVLLYFHVRSLRWWSLLRVHWHGLPFGPLHVSNVVGVVLGNLSPMQAGELFKVELVHRVTGLSRLDLFTTFLFERLLDFSVLLCMFLLGFWLGLGGRTELLQEVPGWLWLLFLPALLLALPVLWILRRRLLRIRRILAPYFLRPGILLRSLLLTLCGWGLVILNWLFFAWMLQIDLRLFDAFFLVGAVIFLRILTMIPGGIGVDEAGLVLLMPGLGYLLPDAQAYALAGRLLDVWMLAIALCYLPRLRDMERGR